MKKTAILATYPNSTFRARRRFGPSSRAKRAFVLGSSLRKIPQRTIWICCLGLFLSCTSNPVSALTYSDNVGVNFTFNTSLSVSLSSTSGGSSADLVVNDLTPGTSSDSNIVDINVLSNNLSGYSLNATVGNDSTYNNANLTSISGDTFTSLTPSDSIVDISSFNDNQWGYSYSDQTASTPTWSDYSGLPLYNTTGATLKTTTGPSASAGDNTYFKIAAKASPTQASGEYSNVINFTVTAEHNPVSFYDAFSSAGKSMYNGYYKMQDMNTSICNSVYTSQLADNTDTMEAQLIDIRDDNIYWVAKLKDGHCWMTQNLDLNGGIAITSDFSDVSEDYILPVANGFQESNRLPESSASGFSDDTIAYLYNSNRDDLTYCLDAPGCYSYYSWTTATLGSGLDISTDNTDAPYSICPRKWHLPNVRNGVDDESDLRALAITLGGTSDTWNYSSSTSPTGAYMLEKLTAAPYNYMMAGFFDDSRHIQGGVTGFYWTATDDEYAGSAHFLWINDGRTYVAGTMSRRVGGSIRCVANND